MRIAWPALLLISAALALPAAAGTKKKKPPPKPEAAPVLHITATGPATLPVPDYPADSLSLTAVGDIMLGTTFPDESGKSLPPNDGADLLTEVTPILSSGDLVFGNLEGPLVDGGASVKCGKKQTKSCWAFRVPTRYGQHLKDAGFNVLGLANNHAMDFGDEGRQSSIQTLDGLGIAHSGPVGDIARMTVKGVKVSVIAFATYDTAYNLNQLDTARDLVKEEAAHSDVVVVSFHGGGEGASRCHVVRGPEMFYNENRGDLVPFAHEMIDAGAAIVLGSGPHVVRGMELYKGRLIAYSLGNFATYGGMNLSGPSGIAFILEAHLAKDGTFLGGKAHPVKQTSPGGPKLDDARQIVPVVRQLSVDDFGKDAPVIADDGAIGAERP